MESSFESTKIRAPKTVSRVCSFEKIVSYSPVALARSNLFRFFAAISRIAILQTWPELRRHKHQSMIASSYLPKSLSS
jgi:hypothetical protein